MPALYPSSIYSPRTKQNRAGVVFNSAKKDLLFADDCIFLDNEVVAIETELGASPKNTSASVAERIKGIRSLSDADSDVIVIKGNKTGYGTFLPGAILDLKSDSTVVNQMWLSDTRAYNKSPLGSFEFALRKNVAGNYTPMASIAGGKENTTDENTAGYLIFRTRTAGAGSVVERMRITSIGDCGFATSTPTARVDINSDILRLRISKTPASAGASGNAGDICWDSSYIYICVATNTWKRVGIATW